MDSDLTFKIIALFVILIMGLGGFCLPLLFKNKASSLSIANCFSAGILFAAGLIHMLPDAEEGLEDWGGDYPWPLFFTTTGFLLILTIEEVSLELISAQEAHKDDAVPTLTRKISFDHRPKMAKSGSALNSNANSHVASRKTSISNSRVSVQSRKSFLRASFENELAYKSVDHGEHFHMDFSEDSSVMLSILLLIALSIHSFLAGISLGATDDSFVSIFIAIIAHKGCAAFALGTSFVQGNVHETKPHLFKISAVLFSCMTPSGVLVGIILKTEELLEPSSEGIILCLAAGTFMYVATMEVMGHEFLKPDHKIPKMVALAFGYAFMAALALWV